MSSDLHRRKSSREDDVDVLRISVTGPPPTTNGDVARQPSPRKAVNSMPDRPNGFATPNAYATGVPQRQRVLSTPAPPTLYSPKVSGQPSSPGPLRATFGSPSPGTSHFRNSLSVQGHVRSPSGSSFHPSAPSPLSMSFPPTDESQINNSIPSPHRQAPPPPVPLSDHRRRHSRIHSRNLSVYFPRPGTLPTASIAEDGAQELELLPPVEAPETLISSAPLQQGRELQPGFKFGGKKVSENGEAERPNPPASAGLIGGTNRASRRGHHHKHSLSHNFFSFMEPEPTVDAMSTPSSALPLTPSSPWQPITPFPTSPSPQVLTHTKQKQSLAFSISTPPSTPPRVPSSRLWPVTLISLSQFVLGSSLWVQGQQCGSLACTGLGYWVVFDAFGVACSRVLPLYLASSSANSTSRRYGNARLETLAVFAQSIYLIFTSVYVSKESVEHLLLSHGEGHHHHKGDDSDLGIEFPIFLILSAVLALVLTSIGFDNNSRLIDATANRIPSLSSLIQSLRYASNPHLSSPPPSPPPTTLIGKAASNPYSAVPVGTAFGMLSIYCFVHPSQHRSADLFLASVLSVLTFSIAYPAALALAHVLLQTAPKRGTAGGRMETFLRTMRELERHPQVLHLPPPHIWQLTPTAQRINKLDESIATLIVTLELHVRSDLDDASVLELTKWAWERCMSALGGDRNMKDGGGPAEVTVGVVKG